MPGTAGADRGKEGGGGRPMPPIPPGSFKPPGKPPGNPPVMGERDPPDIGEELFCVFMPGRGRPARSACSARALAITSIGRLLAAGGRRALLRMPVTLELGLILAAPCGADTVRNEGTRRGWSLAVSERMASQEALGGSSGVLASEESSAAEPGEAGMLSTCSSGVAGTESGEADMLADGGRKSSERCWEEERARYLEPVLHADVCSGCSGEVENWS